MEFIKIIYSTPRIRTKSNRASRQTVKIQEKYPLRLENSCNIKGTDKCRKVETDVFSLVCLILDLSTIESLNVPHIGITKLSSAILYN